MMKMKQNIFVATHSRALNASCSDASGSFYHEEGFLQGSTEDGDVQGWLVSCFSWFQNPSLDFKVVTYELDHPGFQIRDSKGLHIVVFGIQRGLGMEVFPVNAIYRPWKHAEGQVSLPVFLLYPYNAQKFLDFRSGQCELGMSCALNGLCVVWEEEITCCTPSAGCWCVMRLSIELLLHGCALGALPA